MTDKTFKRLEQRNEALQHLNNSEERWFKILIRATNKLNKIRRAKKALLTPRKLKDHEIGISGKDETKIRDTDFGDTATDMFN